MTAINAGTLYEMNKVAVLKLPKIAKSKYNQKLEDIKQFFLKNEDKYFMLLNRETYNFTLFNLGNKNDIAMEKTIEDLKECLDNRGYVVSIEPELNNSYEIWLVDSKQQAYAYYLFPYDLGVIEHGTEEHK